MDTLTSKYPNTFYYIALIPVSTILLLMNPLGFPKVFVVTLQLIALLIQVSSLLICISYKVFAKRYLKNHEGN